MKRTNFEAITYQLLSENAVGKVDHNRLFQNLASTLLEALVLLILLDIEVSVFL